MCLLHEAEEAAEYALVITQAAGLLRYRLGDRVKISGRHRGVPLLRFRGRADAVSDLVGEKLNETFVAQALREVAAAQAFCTLLPVLPESGRPHYWLLTDDPRPVLGQAMEEALMRAFRYRRLTRSRGPSSASGRRSGCPRSGGAWLAALYGPGSSRSR